MDADGNLIQEKNKLTTETKKYYYDSENRLIKYEHQASDLSPVDITAEYQYDIYGRRIQKTVNGVETNFFWDGDTMTLELNDQNKPIRRYITGTSSPRGIASLDASEKLRHSDAIDDYEGQLEYAEVTDWGKIFDLNYPSGWYSYIKDQVGIPKGIASLDASEKLQHSDATIYRVYDHKNHTYVNTRRFDVFGNMLNQTGTTKTNLGFQGKYLDTESGLYYFYHRYYSPSIGRFTTEDPVGFNGGLNLFEFVGNNPANMIDPYGFVIYPPTCGRENLDQKTIEMAECLDDCLRTRLGNPCFEMRVTSTRDRIHSRGSAHYSGEAFDVGLASNPDLVGKIRHVVFCYYFCFKGEALAQLEKRGGYHYHFQTRRGRRGTCGFLPGIQ